MPQASLSPTVAPPEPSQPTRWLAWVAMALTMAALTFFFSFGDNIGDTLLLIKEGQYILAQGALPARDLFSYATQDIPYIAHEWLSGVVFALCYATCGLLGLILLKWLLISATCGLVVWTARCLGASWGIITLLFGPLMVVVSDRVIERPHLFSMLFLVGAAHLLWRVRAGQLAPRWLWLVPPLCVVWVNLHGQWLVGLALIACFAVGEAVHWGRARVLALKSHNSPCRLVLTYAVVLLACCAAVFVNPYGSRLVLHPFWLTSIHVILENNTEWVSPIYLMYYSPRFTVYLCTLLMLTVVWFLGDRQSQRHGRVAFVTATVVIGLSLAVACGQPPDAIPYKYPPAMAGYQVARLLGLYALVVTWGLWALWHWRTSDVTATCVMGLFAVLSIRYTRCAADAALALFPLLTSRISLGLAHRARSTPPQNDRRVLLGACVLVALAGYVVLRGFLWAWSGVHRPLGLEVGASVRSGACAVDAVRRMGLQGRAMTSARTGPPLLFRLWPQVRAGMDGRDYLYGDTLMPELWRVQQHRGRWLADYLTRYDPDFLFMRHLDLLEESRWWLWRHGYVNVHLDDRIFVAVPPRAAYAALIQHEGYRHILPWVNLDIVGTIDAQAALQEAQRALQHCPEGATFAHSYVAKSLHALGRYEEAQIAARHIPKLLFIE